ncbi:zinc finger, BED-type containing 1 [Seminavis robusta]|uniref:Zinc finger, BED-type containing 1 n=1 Tax=Seminavis robusta TaxID=568900 RepID=A0A9N8EI57_9STRA|nr:zinc finger, BED-type containing 1 [Seminavis robusta]|eukprot:Sro1139_g245410.1 zinc finger, BED-type containing 1 (736) ;mRNA; f:7367-9639
MSQPDLPATIAAERRSSVDATSVLTTGTGGISDSDTAAKEQWLTQSSKASVFFCLEACSGSNVTSNVWNFFHIVKGGKKDIDKESLPNADFSKYNEKCDTNRFAACNHCGKILACGTLKKGKTSWTNGALTTHLTTRVEGHNTTVDILMSKYVNASEVGGKKRKTSRQASIMSYGSVKSGGIKKLPPGARKKHQELMTTRWIADSMSPFKTVETDSFRDMIQSYDLTAKPMSNKKVKSIMINLEDAMRDAAIETMTGLSVNFTLDHWTSKRNENYTGVTAHFIDNDFKLHNVDLGIFLHEGDTTAEELEKSFLELSIEKLNLGVAKVFAGTTDTTGNMNSLGMKWERNQNIAHVYCTDHVLQLTCKLCYNDKTKKAVDAFGEEFVGCVNKARAIVKFVNNSSQALEKLKKHQAQSDSCEGPPKGLIDDVVTRWWATYAMIVRLLELKPAIQTMFIYNELDITTVLKPFKDAQKMLEGDKYVTASWVVYSVKNICDTLTALSSSGPTTASKELARNLLEDFKKRWGSADEPVFNPEVQRGERNRQTGIHPALLIATLLDPRFKSLISVPDEGSKVAIRERVLEIMKMSEIEKRDALGGGIASAGDDVKMEEEKQANDDDEDNSSDDEDPLEVFEQQVAAVEVGKQASASDDSIEKTCKDELKRYIEAGSLPIRKSKHDKTYNDPLGWWKKNQSLYPILASLAKIYLSVQATSAPSERIFSAASRLISNKRTKHVIH